MLEMYGEDYWFLWRSRNLFLTLTLTPAHMALKLAADTRSGDTPHHDWNRSAERLRTTWMSQIVQDTGLTAVDAWAVAEDQPTWRALRPTAG